MEKRVKIAWSKENKFWFLIGAFLGGGLVFEGIGKFMGLTLSYILGLICFVISLILYGILEKMIK